MSVDVMTPAAPTSPASDLTGLSGWAIRAELARQGRPGVSNAQLRQFADVGLLERTGDGYAHDSVDRVVGILEAEPHARNLARRVVWLRADFLHWPIAAGPLREAFIRLAPTIRRPMQKLRQVERGWAAMGVAVSGRGTIPPPRVLPASSNWAALVTSISPGEFEARATGWYALARNFLPSYLQEAARKEYELIPLEERVVMVAILDRIALSPP